jgi:hypothetical protein
MASMDYRRGLKERNSKQLWIEIFNDVGSDKHKLSELMELFLGDDKRLAQSSSQPVGMIGEKKIELIQPYLVKMVKHLKTNPIDGVKRNILRTFQFNSIPIEVEGEFFDITLNYLISISEAVAIKAFSMIVIRKICQKYPELTQEVIPIIERLVEESESSGIKHRGNKELIELRIIQKSMS